MHGRPNCGNVCKNIAKSPSLQSDIPVPPLPHLPTLCPWMPMKLWSHWYKKHWSQHKHTQQNSILYQSVLSVEYFVFWFFVILNNSRPTARWTAPVITGSETIFTYLPTKFSRTLLLPALWLPTTAIWGRSSDNGIPNDEKTSCSLFTIGINCSMPTFPDILAIICAPLLYSSYIWHCGRRWMWRHGSHTTVMKCRIADDVFGVSLFKHRSLLYSLWFSHESELTGMQSATAMRFIAYQTWKYVEKQHSLA